MGVASRESREREQTTSQAADFVAQPVPPVVAVRRAVSNRGALVRSANSSMPCRRSRRAHVAGEPGEGRARRAESGIFRGRGERQLRRAGSLVDRRCRQLEQARLLAWMASPTPRTTTPRVGGMTTYSMADATVSSTTTSIPRHRKPHIPSRERKTE